MTDSNNIKYPNAFYRVGVKAVIKDNEGRVLCVHDTGDDDMWSLPGGGIDHGDDIRSGLARELVEEIDYSGEFSMELRETAIYFSKAFGAHVLYMIYDVRLLESYDPHAGIDAKAVAYLTLEDIEKYKDRQADIIRKFGFEIPTTIPMYK